MVSLKRRFALGVFSAGVLAAGVAVAAEELPEPTSCAGVAFVDPAGDATYTPTSTPLGPVPSARKANDNLDVREGFFRYAPDGGANVLTANVRFANLTQTLDTGSTAIVWYMKWRMGTVLHYAAATSNGTAVEYTYGTQAGSSLTELGTTTGKLFEGKDGIVQIVLPVGALQLEGKKLEKPFGVGAYAQGTSAPLPSASLSSTADSGPDNTTTGGKDFVVTACAEEDVPTPLEPVPTTTPTPTPAPGATPTPTPPPSGGGGGGSGQPPAAQPPAAGPPAAVAGPVRLNLSVVAGKQSARKIARKRRLSVGLTSTGRVSAITAKLLRGKKLVAKAKLAQVNGKGRLTFKLKKPKRGKKLKFRAGAYTLLVTGRNADGKVATGAVQIAVRK